MGTERLGYWFLTLAVIGLATWVAIVVMDGFAPSPLKWDVRVQSPVLVGNALDSFVYAGGADVRPVEGEGDLRRSRDVNSIQLSFQSNPEDPWILDNEVLIGEVVLETAGEEAASTWFKVPVFGDSGLGESRLPQTVATLAGTSRFDVLVNGRRVRGDVLGVWAVADALRHDDGSIRQQGLVFSPLLRDKTGFSDPERLEFTLLLVEPAGDGADRVLLHLVFREVSLVASPERS